MMKKNSISTFLERFENQNPTTFQSLPVFIANETSFESYESSISKENYQTFHMVDEARKDPKVE